MKKVSIALLAAVALLFTACETTATIEDKDPAVGKGAVAWNTRGPEAATAYWEEIQDSSKQKKYLNYVTLYKAGLAALDSTDSIKSTNEAKLLSACNTAMNKFGAIDSALKLPANVCNRGANLAAGRIDKLLAAEKITEAKTMYNKALKLYGTNSELSVAGKEVDVVNSISSKRQSLLSQAEKAGEIENFDEKVAAYDAIIAKCPAVESEVNALVKNSGVGDKAGVTVNQKAFKKVRQDIQIQRSSAFRTQAYSYKDRMGEEFARQPAEGTGHGKNGSFTVYDIRDHYKAVGENMDAIYAELEAFVAKYPKDVGSEVLSDAKDQKNNLNEKIAEINKEIAIKEEIESRGKTVMPLMIGLFNADPSSSKNNAKSRPAKFSATKATKAEYWWGMVDIPKGTMNDLVITLKDNRTVRVFNQNTKSGKLIEKNNLKDLVSLNYKSGNSWPVLNAGNQLNGNKYFFEIQKGKTDSYSGTVVVYSSFVVRKR